MSGGWRRGGHDGKGSPFKFNHDDLVASLSGFDIDTAMARSQLKKLKPVTEFTVVSTEVNPPAGPRPRSRP